VQILTDFTEQIPKKQVLRPLAEKRGLDTWEKIVGLTGNEWFPSRVIFGKFKGKRYQEAREDPELMSWLEWLAESTNERSSAMGRWYLKQLKNGSGLEDAAFLDLQFQEDAGGTSVAAGLVVFQQPEMELYQRLVEAARNRLAELELECKRSTEHLSHFCQRSGGYGIYATWLSMV
jgi:DNA polymerase-3 subunit epsilon